MKTLNARELLKCVFVLRERFLISSAKGKNTKQAFFSILQNYYYYTNNRYIKIQFAMTSDSESESDDEEYNQGPDIFEAAADEEIKEDHWCARFSFSFSKKVFSPHFQFPAVKCKRAIPYFLHSFSNSLLLFHRVGSITCAKI